MKFIRRVGKLLLYVLAILLAFFAIVAITIQYPSVQTSLTEKATNLLSEQLKTDVHVGGVDIDFFKTAVLQDIYIGDRQNDTLLFAERLAVDIGVLDLFQSEIFLNKIKLENAYVNLYKAEADSAFNYQFIIDNFSSTTPTDSSSTAPWTFGLGKVILENVRFGMRDEGSGRFDLQTQISEWAISADELDFEKQAIELERLDLSNSTIVFRQLQKDTTTILKKEEKTPLTFPGIGWTINVDKIRLQNNHVAILDDNAPVLENALDYSHLDLQNLNLSIDDFQYADEGILLKINEASLSDRSGFVLEKMEGKVVILPNRIAIEDFLFKTPKSDFENDTELVFNVFDDLPDFINKVKLESQFAESHLAVSDLLLIAPQLDKVPNLNFPNNEILNFQGKITLQEDQLHLQNFSFSVGEATKLQANGHIAQLTTDPDYDLDIQKLTTSYLSLRQYTKDVELPAGLANFGQLQLSGKIKGTLGDLSAKDLTLTTEAATRFAGDLDITGLPDIDRTIFNLTINDLTTQSADLNGFSTTPLPPELDSLGLIQFAGQFNGTIRDFVINGGFKTGAGNAKTNLKMAFNQAYSDATYQGKLSLENFDMGRVLADTSQFGALSLNLQLNGRGLAIDSLDTTMEGVVNSAIFNQYEYNDLHVDGHFIQRLFEGKMNMQDENLSFELLGKVNLNDSLPQLDATVRIDTINLKSLHFYEEQIGISGVIEANLKGSNLDNLDGKATLTNLAVSSEEQKYFDKKIVLEAKQWKAGSRALLFDSGFLKANIAGRYNFGDLSDLVIGYINDFFPVEELALPPDSLLTPRPDKADQQFDFDFQFTNLTSLVSVFLPDFQEMDSSAFLRGKFDSADKQLELMGQFPNIVYQGSQVDSFSLKMNGNRRRLRTYLKLSNLNFNNTFFAPILSFNTRLGDDTLRFDLAVQDDSLNYLFKWGGKANEMPTDYQLVFDRTMVLNEEKWDIDPKNQLLFDANQLFFQNLIFSKGQQAVAINSIDEAPTDDLAPMELRFDHFKLSEVSALLNNPSLRLEGDLNGRFMVKEPKKNLHYNADVRVGELALNEQLLGDFNLEAAQPRGQQAMTVLANLKGENEMTLKGNYNVPQNQFDLRADIEKLSLVVADPFLSELMKDSRGYLSGNFTLTGTPETPALNGRITTHDISTHVIMTGTRYRTHENTITISEKEIDFGELELYDPAGRKAVVTGGITHEYFDKMKFDLRAKTDGLKILDTARKDNPLYYGRLFARADVHITGTPELPVLDVVATTNDSTLLHVEPLITNLAVVQEDYIIFDNPNDYEPDSLSLIEQRVGANSVGLDLTLTLIVTPAAQLNIIIDPLTGDELFCSGTGNFNIRMNPAGDITITGTYTIENGQYSFAYEGLVKRNFEIRKGSSLSFGGDPYNARFDITAVYKTRATTYELISNEATLDDATSANSKRRTDVEVLLNIDGDLTEPVITFDIELPQSQGGAVDNLVARKLNDLRDEPTELNKQVFGLLFLNSFIQSETGAGLANVGENAALKSVSGLISNQLNRLANRFIKGVDLKLGFESYRAAGQDAGTVSELQVGLSKQLFNDRLTIQVGGNFNLENSEQSALQEGGYSAIAGDFVLEYKLTEKGNYLLKVFHKSDYNALLGSTNKTGVGIGYRKSY
jgi:hypothetical protein